LIHSYPDPKNPRNRLYSEEEIDRRVPGKPLQGPVLESAITLIEGDHLYYRGHDATGLAKTKSVEEVASIIWNASGFSETQLHVVSGRATEGLPFANRAASVLPIVAARDPLAYDLRPHAVAQTGWRILNLLASVAAETSELADTVDETLQKKWAPKSRDLIRAALILCADHELNVSSFTARCVASAGSNPYAVVAAGLAALEGNKHGGMTARIATMIDEVERARDIRGAMSERMRRGEPIFGFGHRLYPNGDPRATVLLDRLPNSKAASFARKLIGAAHTVLGERPTLDVGLVAVARSLGLPRGAALTLFAIGRTIGWIGHAIEQYARDAVIRPRAKYVGDSPREGPG
jgi:citrate synthase